VMVHFTIAYSGQDPRTQNCRDPEITLEDETGYQYLKDSYGDSIPALTDKGLVYWRTFTVYRISQHIAVYASTKLLVNVY
jgi:hypothetical protein